MQIFEESLDFETTFQDIDPSILPILKSPTIVNPVYGAKAGQKVEILMFRANSNIPTSLFDQLCDTCNGTLLSRSIE